MPNFPNGLRVVTVVSTNDYPTVRGGKMDASTNGMGFLTDASNNVVAILNPAHLVALIAL